MSAVVLTYLYRCWDQQGQLLYVGVTENPKGRATAHAQTKFWWQDVARITTMAFERRIEAEWAEWAVITTCSPIYNRAAAPPALPIREVGNLDQGRLQPRDDSDLQSHFIPTEGQAVPRQHPRDRVRRLVLENHQEGIGPRAVHQVLRAEGYRTAEQTVITWMRKDARHGLLAQPQGNGSPYFPGPRLTERYG